MEPHDVIRALRERWVKERETAQAAVDRLTFQIKDLDKTWRKALEAQASATGNARKGPSLTQLVESALQGLPDQFETPEAVGAVLDASGQEHGYQDNSVFRANVSNALRQLEKRGILTTLRKSRGSVPTLYAKLGTATEGGGDMPPE